ncbi:cyclin-dependent kinase 9-like [Cloeon dipterum]|uniref:cyclin-dependent kinase 9-like n=1 Tax=Cloeon dipterum TaxID=197152 RepID=UPI003220478B
MTTSSTISSELPFGSSRINIDPPISGLCLPTEIMENMVNYLDTLTLSLGHQLATFRSCQTQPSKLIPHQEIDNFPPAICMDVGKYKKIAKIGVGTFGEVFKARDWKDWTKYVAIKRVLIEKEGEGFPTSFLRELTFLRHLKHENIGNLIDICCSKPHPNTPFISTYLVFDFCEHNLADLLSNANAQLTLGEIKNVMQQLLTGTHYLHLNKILHRDMKTSNILVSKSGCIKVSDFGLSRAFSVLEPMESNSYKNPFVTLWYRPPELLLGEQNYASSVDMWGVGCVMAEMWTRSSIMQGHSEINQLTLISILCGSITPDVWPGVDKLELFGNFDLPRNQKRKVTERLQPYLKDSCALDLIDKLLVLDPKNRIDTETALDHGFFSTNPMPTGLSKMLANYTQSLFECKVPPRRQRRGKRGASHSQQDAQAENLKELKHHY